MVINLKYSEVKPVWNWGGFIPHKDNLDSVFNQSKDFTLLYNPASQSMSLMLTKEEANKIYLIKSDNDLDYGTKIFVKDKIIRFNSKQFEVRFILDIKYTFYLLISNTPALSSLKGWTTRSSIGASYYHHDEYLDYQTYNHWKINSLEYRFTNENGSDYVYQSGIYENSIDRFKLKIRNVEGRNINPSTSPILYFVFSKKLNDNQSTNFTILPLISPATSKDVEPKMWYNDTQIFNSWVGLNELFIKEFANSFVGIFFGPSLLHFDTTTNDSITKKYIINTYAPSSASITRTYLVLELPEQGIYFKSFIPIREVKKDTSTSDNLYLLNQKDCWYLGANLKNKGVIRKKEVLFSDGAKTLIGIDLDGLLSFSNTGFSITLRDEALAPENRIINFGGTISFFSDDYAAYINSTRNTIDTSLNIAKQNAIMSGVESSVGATLSGVGSLLTGNIFGAISSGIKGVFSLAKSGLGYKQEKDRINAMLADKKASANNELHSSNDYINSLLISSLSYNGIKDTTIITDFGFGSEDQLPLINNILKYNGRKDYRSISFDDINSLASNETIVYFEQNDLRNKILSKLPLLNFDFNWDYETFDLIEDLITILRISKEQTMEQTTNETF